MNIFNKNFNILRIYAIINSIISGVGPTENPYIKYLLDISVLLKTNRRRLNTIKEREKIL